MFVVEGRRATAIRGLDGHPTPTKLYWHYFKITSFSGKLVYKINYSGYLVGRKGMKYLWKVAIYNKHYKNEGHVIIYEGPVGQRSRTSP